MLPNEAIPDETRLESFVVPGASSLPSFRRLWLGFAPGDPGSISLERRLGILTSLQKKLSRARSRGGGEVSGSVALARSAQSQQRQAPLRGTLRSLFFLVLVRWGAQTKLSLQEGFSLLNVANSFLHIPGSQAVRCEVVVRRFDDAQKKLGGGGKGGSQPQLQRRQTM